MNNLYNSVSAMKIWKPIVSHTSCIYKSFNVAALGVFSSEY